MSTPTQPAVAGRDGIVPTHPSNRSFIAMLRSWGIEVEEGGERWRAKMPSGENLVVLAPTYHDGNPRQVFHEAYKALGLTDAQFWAGPVAEAEPVAPVEAVRRPPRRQYINRVMDCLVQFGAPMSIQRIAEELGLTSAQASSACGQLKSSGAVEMVKAGVYVAKQYASDARVAIDISGPDGPIVLQQEPAPTPTPIRPTAVVAVDDDDDGTAPDIEVDELLEIVLDLMFPTGMNVRAGDLKVIADWVASTKVLLQRVGGAVR